LFGFGGDIAAHVSYANRCQWAKSSASPADRPAHKICESSLPGSAPWQAAAEALLLVVELGGPTMFARIGVMQALNRHVERVFNPDHKDHHWGRRKLARDQ
jgi:hypothetical protein